MITGFEISLVLTWLVLIIFLHLSLLPLFRRYPGRVAVPLAFSISLLTYTLLSYWAVLVHLPVQVALLPFLVVSIYHIVSSGNRSVSRALTCIKTHFSQEWRYYALFFAVFLAMLALRVFSPDISSAEKFMDHGFIASMMRMTVIPPLDPWFAGGDLSVYYYLGHWMIACLGLTAGIQSPQLFTLALPTIAALVAVNLYGIGSLLLSRFRLLLVLLFFLINPAFVQLSIAGREWGSLLWDSTRVIDGTINEYPLFSFIFGDVHAHVLGIFPQTTLLLLITLAITCWKEIHPLSRLVLILASGLALGTIPPTNTWDILVQAPLVLLTGAVLLYDSAGSVPAGSKDPSSIRSRLSAIIAAVRTPGGEGIGARTFSEGRGALLYLVLVPLIGILCYLPFYLMMKAQGIGGVALVHAPSSIPQFLLVSGWFVVIITFSLLPVFRKNPWILLLALPFIVTGYYAAAIPALLLGGVLVRRTGAADLLAGVGLAILIFCEIIYLRDNMGEQYFRMNTVFKFYITAWIALSAGSAVMLGKLLQTLTHPPSLSSRLVQGTIFLMLLLVLVLPVFVTASHSGPHTPTMDGLAWLSSGHPDDLAAIHWLRTLEGNITLVEAEGGDYGYYGRVSSFTGIPALLGWPFHESMWRNNTPPGWYAQRTTVIRTIYEDPFWCEKLMRMFRIDLLYVGPAERERYHVTLPDEGITPVFDQGAVTIYRLTTPQEGGWSGDFSP